MRDEWYYKNRDRILAEKRRDYVRRGPKKKIRCGFCASWFLPIKRHQRFCTEYCCLHGRLLRERDNPEIVIRKRKWNRDYARRQREKLIKEYGGKCACCNESRIEFLAAHHINGGGPEERRLLGSGPYRKNLEGRKDIQLLCHCCHMSMTFYGYCPHRREYDENRIVAS